ncbi:hypothetical protein HDU96_011071 [Phlyctochytrium bullatum]|nr:hypothetical protein HDU96_011071 [Phlyctochytrium bullatum]
MDWAKAVALTPSQRPIQKHELSRPQVSSPLATGGSSKTINPSPVKTHRNPKVTATAKNNTKTTVDSKEHEPFPSSSSTAFFSLKSMRSLSGRDSKGGQPYQQISWANVAAVKKASKIPTSLEGTAGATSSICRRAEGGVITSSAAVESLRNFPALKPSSPRQATPVNINAEKMDWAHAVRSKKAAPVPARKQSPSTNKI